MDYIKFLHSKLYLIECIARRGVLAEGKDMKEILELCMASYSKINQILEDKCSTKNN